jgi:hypothetical protein
MKIRGLRLQNYRNHVDSTLSLENTTFCIIRGANASGKTSISQAISLSLADTTMGLQADGKGYQSKIRDGQKSATITTEIQGQHILEKTVTLNLSAAGRTQVVKCLDAPDDKKIVNGFENFLARYNDALRIALNTDYFAKMDSKDQKNLLAKLVLPSRYDFPQDKIEAVNALLDTAIDFNAEPFAVIELAYKKLYKERESVNRDVKNFVIPEALPMPKGIDSESLQKELTEVREEREKLQKERDAAVGEANKIEVERGKLQTSINSLLTRVDEGKKRLVTIEASILSDENLRKLKAVEGKAEELAQLKMNHAGILGSIKTCNQQIDRLGELSDKGATCPTCEQTIDKAKIIALIGELQKESAEADAKLQQIDKQIAAIGDCAQATATIQKHEQALKEKTELTASIVEIVEEGKKTRAALNKLGEKKEDATLSFNDPLGTLQAKEDKIIEQLTPVITAEQRAKDIKTKTEQFEKLEAKAKTLDELTKFFDKDGIKKTLIGQYIGGFQQKLYSVMTHWGYKAELSSDLSSFDVTTHRGYTGPVKEISGAEEHIFKCAFQCAVSIAAGIKMVVIDEVEQLGEDIRQALYKAVFDLIQDKQLDQAIMIGFSLDKTVPDAEHRAPGSRYFYVEDGEVEVLG